MHGAHKSRNAAKGEDHYNFQHGQATKAARAENARTSAELHMLRDLGVALGMFDDQPTGWPGRKPEGYRRPDLQNLISQIQDNKSGKED